MAKGYHKPESLDRRRKEYDNGKLPGNGYKRPGSSKK